MHRWGWLLLLGGCDRNLGSIEGFDLGHARSAVWATEPETDRVFVVATDDDGDLCKAVGDGRTRDGTWTLVLWSTEAASYETDLSADAWVDLRDGLIDDTFGGNGLVWVDDGNTLQVHVDLDFDDDRLKGNLDAESCDADLFAFAGG
jgi:hypothetical protein